MFADVVEGVVEDLDRDFLAGGEVFDGPDDAGDAFAGDLAHVAVPLRQGGEEGGGGGGGGRGRERGDPPGHQQLTRPSERASS